jgi:hypothetical protein
MAWWYVSVQAQPINGPENAITYSEIELALKQRKIKTGPVPAGLTAEMVKALGHGRVNG